MPEEFASFLKDVGRKDRPRLRLEGVALPAMSRAHVQHDPLTRVDFVECDLSQFNVDRARFKRDVLIEDCSFDRVVWNTRIAHTRMRSCSFQSVTLQRVIIESTVEDCRFSDCRLENFQFVDASLRSVEMTGLTVTRSHWPNCRFDGVRLTGRAKTLVFSGATFDDVDLRELRLMDSDLGDFSAVGPVRFPTFDDSFVVTREGLAAANQHLATMLSPAAHESFIAMAAALPFAYAVIDRSLFAVAPDLPGMETTPADVDAIMSTLRRHRVEEIPGQPR